MDDVIDVDFDLMEDYKGVGFGIELASAGEVYYWIELGRCDVPFNCVEDAIEAAKEEIDSLVGE
jgi:hypothetical protein